MRGVFFTVINNGLEVYNLLVPLKSANVNKRELFTNSFGNRGVYFPEFSMKIGHEKAIFLKHSF